MAETTPLTDEELQAVLVRLPTVQTAEGDVQEYALPSESLPPPRPGRGNWKSHSHPPRFSQPSKWRAARWKFCASPEGDPIAPPERHLQPANGSPHQPAPELDNRTYR